MNTATMFSTGKDDWSTPDSVFLPLMDEFRFTLDAAANSANRRCCWWFGPDHHNETMRDALSLDWGHNSVWLNPPYSRGLQSQFIAKAFEAALGGATVVMLLPARTDTRAFHSWIWDADTHKPRPYVRELRFLKGRVRFVGAPASAPFPSMIVVVTM